MIGRRLVNGVESSAISVDDRGLQYGDGLFETMAAMNGRSRRRTRSPSHGPISIRNSGADAWRNTALAAVKRSPVSCIPSPESPAKRMITRSSSTTGPRLVGSG